MAAEAHGIHGSLDILVLNAGGGTGAGQLSAEKDSPLSPDGVMVGLRYHGYERLPRHVNVAL